ncbi:MAG: hypothetical protein J0I07_04650, partial [Myxococcales bacterium]|nr:hypothetical protein [Myxococcales bacterium]
MRPLSTLSLPVKLTGLKAGDEAFVLSHDGFIRWVGEPVARLVAGEKVLEPRLRLLVEEHLTGPAREQVENRLTLW